MKKLLLILILIIPFIGGCKKEKNIEKENPFKRQIVGQWTLNTAERGTIKPTYEQYTFDSENNFQFFRLVREVATNQILGYQSKKTGKYRIEGEKLIFYDTTTYTNDFSKGQYSSEDKLIKTTSETYRASISINNNVLILSFPCPPNVDCFGTYIYQRKLTD
jgi:hypothetical protein